MISKVRAQSPPPIQDRVKLDNLVKDTLFGHQIVSVTQSALESIRPVTCDMSGQVMGVIVTLAGAEGSNKYHK